MQRAGHRRVRDATMVPISEAGDYSAGERSGARRDYVQDAIDAIDAIDVLAGAFVNRRQRNRAEAAIATTHTAAEAAEIVHVYGDALADTMVEAATADVALTDDCLAWLARVMTDNSPPAMSDALGAALVAHHSLG